jgi:hypothetical protein
MAEAYSLFLAIRRVTCRGFTRLVCLKHPLLEPIYPFARHQSGHKSFCSFDAFYFSFLLGYAPFNIIHKVVMQLYIYGFFTIKKKRRKCVFIAVFEKIAVFNHKQASVYFS